jgi:hypothetical protein
MSRNEIKKAFGIKDSKDSIDWGQGFGNSFVESDRKVFGIGRTIRCTSALGSGRARKEKRG